MLEAVGPMISQRANIGWTTLGHTGEDIVLYSYLPNNSGNESLASSKTLISRPLSAKVFGTDLHKVTNTLYIDANAQFAAKGAKATVDNATAGGTQLVVTKGKSKLTIPENKNFVLLNGKKVKSNGINVNIYDTFYVSKSVIDLID